MELFPDEKLEEVNENLHLIQKKNGLTFGTDAYLLYAYLRRQPRATAVDLGSGTGILSLLCAAGGKMSHITAVEIQPAFAELIARNAELNNLTQKITPLCRDVRTLSLQDFSKPVDVVFSNPPYLTQKQGSGNVHDAKNLARHEEMGNISDFVHLAASLLKHGGLFDVVWRPERLADLFCALRDHGMEPKRMTMVYPTACHVPCLVLCESKKGACPGLFVTKPLILQQKNDDGVLIDTEDNQFIYKHGAFDERYEKP